MNIHRLTGILLQAGTSVCSGGCFLLAGYKAPSLESIVPFSVGLILSALSWKVGYHRGRFDAVRGIRGG